VYTLVVPPPAVSEETTSEESQSCQVEQEADVAWWGLRAWQSDGDLQSSGTEGIWQLEIWQTMQKRIKQRRLCKSDERGTMSAPKRRIRCNEKHCDLGIKPCMVALL
jgi:hypothetical protein